MPQLGIIDVGSNTVRLSVVEVRPNGAYVVRHEQKASLRLAARLQADGSLGAQAAADTVRVLDDFKAAGAGWEVSRWLAVATAAVRQATDGAAFLQRINAATGLGVQLLGAEEEANLGLIGGLNTLAVTDGYTVDIGGGSMEVTRFQGRRRVAGASLTLGAVNTAERFGLKGRAKTNALAELHAAVEREAGAALDWMRPSPDLPLIGIGGSVRALAKVDRRQRRYPLVATHNYTMSAESVVALRDRLVALSPEERQHLPGVAADRAEILAAGAALLGWIVERLAPKGVVVSGSGLREGLFFRALLQDQPNPVVTDVLGASVTNLERLHDLPEARARRLGTLAGSLWAGVSSVAGDREGVGARLAPIAARLRDLGTTISYYDRERHAAYVLREGRVFGLDHRERLLLSAAAGYASVARVRQWLSPYGAILQRGDVQLATCMGVCVALTHGLEQEARGRAMPLAVRVLPSAVHVTVAAGPRQGFTGVLSLGSDFRKAFGRALAVSVGEGTTDTW